MECYENGLISRDETDGLDLTWGNADALVSLVEKMARREGLGDVLADGVEKAARHIGRGSEKYAMHIHGQGIAYHDPRIEPCRGTYYIANATPSRHTEASPMIVLEHGGSLGSDPLLETPKLEIYGDFQNKGPMYSKGANFAVLLSSSGLCSLLSIANTVPVAEFLAAGTGWEFGWAEGLEAGHRILTLRQAFNAREGLLPDDFRLPERVKTPAPIGEAAGLNIDFDSLKKGYFEAMGWDINNGKPWHDTLVHLGIDELTSDL